jgi:hypothetical protein
MVSMVLMALAVWLQTRKRVSEIHQKVGSDHCLWTKPKQWVCLFCFLSMALSVTVSKITQNYLNHPKPFEPPETC